MKRTSVLVLTAFALAGASFLAGRASVDLHSPVAPLPFVENPLPQPGDIYEELLTGNRYEIDRVGFGKDLNAFYEGYNDRIEETTESVALRFSLLMLPRMSDDDSLKMCFSYLVQEHVSAGAGKDWVVDGQRYNSVAVSIAKIEPVEELAKRYKKLN